VLTRVITSGIRDYREVAEIAWWQENGEQDSNAVSGPGSDLGGVSSGVQP